MIARRGFAAAALALAAAPGGAWAQQQSGLRRVVFFALGSADDWRIQAFRLGLRDYGYEDGRNIAVEYTLTTPNEIQQRAAEIVASRPALVIVSTTPLTLALMRETKTTPIVAVVVGNPLDTGMAARLAMAPT